MSSPLQGGRVPSPWLPATRPRGLPGAQGGSFPPKVGKLRRNVSSGPPPRVSGPLSQGFSRAIWYLVSLDPGQALRSWNSRRPLLPLGALRQKKPEGQANEVPRRAPHCPSKPPLTYLPSLWAWQPHGPSLTLVTLEEKQGHTQAIRSADPRPDPAWPGCPPFLLSPAWTSFAPLHRPTY